MSTPEPVFRAKVRPPLCDRAQQLVAIYEAVPGSTGPGCCPEALAAVLRHLAEECEALPWDAPDPCALSLLNDASLLEGGQ